LSAGGSVFKFQYSLLERFNLHVHLFQLALQVICSVALVLNAGVRVFWVFFPAVRASVHA
jgi:hypothetical protein